MIQEFQEIIQNYGLWVVLIWTLIEGETGVILAGSLAQQGYFDIRLVALTAFIGALIGDQSYFWLGRYYGNRIFTRFPRLGVHAQRARNLLERYHTPFILGNRFMYGVRIAGPMVVGTTSIPSLRFTGLNMVSGALWATSIAGLGYLFAGATELIISNVQIAEKVALVLVVGVGIAAWFFHRWRGRTRTEKERLPAEN